MEFVAYHGTDKQIATNIISSDFRHNNKVGWLGTGIYFFNENENMAYKWADTKKRCTTPTVLRCEISLPDGKIFDTTMPGSEHNEKFHMYRNILKMQLKSRNRSIKARDQEDFDGKTYNFICQREGYELVKAHTYTYDADDSDFGNSRVPNGTELCLRNTEFIVSKQEIKYHQ
ncbi:hypothetical protein CN418_22825 [Bacillus thuringiensis]|uniref:hypothetical protein n=1 Tax=Bacillus thuringiensis TaxID=1428 RepID=UPI000BF43203|nr:hypothetical protein [Bacillus thuringiensis]PEV10269.1 hypothetical protein CN418_22825 [Bacillus thuringiensis]